MLHALIIDSDATTSAMLAGLAQAESYACAVADDVRQAGLQAKLQPPDIVFLCDSQPDGTELIASMASDSGADMVMMGACPSAPDVVQAFRQGAADYLLKPVDPLRVRQLLRQRMARLADGKPSDRRVALRQPDSGRIVQAPVLLGESAPMKTLRHHIDRVAPTEASVLLLGESGTGKELVAQTIHCQSERRRQAFLPVNCGAISPQLIESEIFGHEKGSFTGADRQHKGYFERASGGTLFLDEVIEMPIELQVKLLRVLETGTFMRIGSNQELQTDVRIIAATNRDPEGAIAEGRLRLDLYHRLNVFPLAVPPLRERGKDIELLAQHFLDEFNTTHATSKRMPAQVQAGLRHYHWPGNVRELRNFMQRAYILADEIIDTPVIGHSAASSEATALTLAIPVGTSLADMDRKLIFATLDLCGGVKKRAADLLGISLKTLYNRLEEYGSTGKGLPLMERRAARSSLCMPGRDSSLLN